jgi:hypothetical protein
MSCKMIHLNFQYRPNHSGHVHRCRPGDAVVANHFAWDRVITGQLALSFARELVLP